MGQKSVVDPTGERHCKCAFRFAADPSRLSLYAKNSTSAGAATSTKGPAPSATQSPVGPTVVQSVGGYVSQGCWSEATTGRALSAAAFANDSMTIEMCAQDCKGYAMFGVEYGREWYDYAIGAICGKLTARSFCGTSPAPGSAKVANQNDCNFKCPGAPSEYCGAGNRSVESLDAAVLQVLIYY